MNLSIIEFKAGAYVTVENKLEGDHFFIIKKGKVRVSSSLKTEAVNLNKMLGPGDFFGVTSSMTGHPRLESTVVLEDTQLIQVRKNQFGFLIQKSAPLALKIIRSFSNDLRRYDIELAKKTFKTSHEEESDNILFDNGRIYFEKGNYLIASYVLLQFIKHTTNKDLAQQSIEILKQISHEIIMLLKANNQVNRAYQDGQMLFSEGEKGYEAFVIEVGQVKITKLINGKEILIAVLNPGDIFGEMALLNNEKRAASAVAYGATSCMALNKSNFDNLIKQNVQIAIKIITLLSERIWTIYKQLDNLSLESLKARIYDTLLTQLLKVRIPIVPRKSYHFHFGVNELKKMIAVDPEETEQAMQDILLEKIITLKEEKVFCADVTFLQKEVEFAKKMQQRNKKIQSRKSALE